MPVKKLEALEADDLAQPAGCRVCPRPGGVGVPHPEDRSRARRQKLPQLHAASPPVGGPGEEVRHRGPRMSASFGLPKPVLLLTAALLIGAVVVLLLPSLRSVGGPATVSTDSAVAPAVVDTAAFAATSGRGFRAPATTGTTAPADAASATATAAARPPRRLQPPARPWRRRLPHRSPPHWQFSRPGHLHGSRFKARMALFTCARPWTVVKPFASTVPCPCRL